MSPEEVVKRAITYFGAEGLGLEMTQEEACCLHFVGGDGHSDVSANAENGGSAVELETQQWEYHVKRFIQKLNA